MLVLSQSPERVWGSLIPTWVSWGAGLIPASLPTPSLGLTGALPGTLDRNQREWGKPGELRYEHREPMLRGRIHSMNKYG